MRDVVVDVLFVVPDFCFEDVFSKREVSTAMELLYYFLVQFV